MAVAYSNFDSTGHASGWRTFRDYKDRNAILRSLGFTTYSAYMKSKLWADIRSRVMPEGVQCLGCNNDATQAHHEFYSVENLCGQSIVGIVPLCSKCHEYIEVGGGKVKLTPTQVEYRLTKLRAKKAGKKVKLTRKRRLTT